MTVMILIHTNMKTGLAGLVHHPEEVSGPAEQEPHHPHVSGEAGQVEGRVAAGAAPSRNLHLVVITIVYCLSTPGLVSIVIVTLGWFSTALTTFSEPE